MRSSSWEDKQYGDGFQPDVEGVIRVRPKFQTKESGVLFVHGAGGTETSWMEQYGRQGELSNKIVSEGHLGISGDNAGAQTWGNAQSVGRMESNRQLLNSLGNVEKYGILGGSMGGQIAFNFAAQAVNKPSAIVAIIPVMNVEDIRANNRDGYAPLIEAAYGGYNESTMGQFFNPYTMRNDAKLKGIPTLIFYGALDTLCLPTFVTQYVAADPTYRTAVSLPYGHQEEAYAAVNQQMVTDFFNTHLA